MCWLWRYIAQYRIEFTYTFNVKECTRRPTAKNQTRNRNSWRREKPYETSVRHDCGDERSTAKQKELLLRSVNEKKAFNIIKNQPEKHFVWIVLKRSRFSRQQKQPKREEEKTRNTSSILNIQTEEAKKKLNEFVCRSQDYGIDGMIAPTALRTKTAKIK